MKTIRDLSIFQFNKIINFETQFLNGTKLTEENNKKNSIVLFDASIVKARNSIELTNKIIREHEKRHVINTFETINIGTQIWCTENLDVSLYRNGDIIPKLQDEEEWDKAGKEGIGAWCYYERKTENGSVFGKLYNWYAVNDLRGLAPSGYHIPTKDEWAKLTNFLGGEFVAGGAIKEAGTTQWLSPNIVTTNSSGFKGLPNPIRVSGSLRNEGDFGQWWSSTEGDIIRQSQIVNAWKFLVAHDSSRIYMHTNYKGFGFAIRCLKD